MTDTPTGAGPLFEVRAETRVTASPAVVYETVSDLPRSGAWSPECQGGEWVSGEPATVGAVFRGRNYRSEDVVAWAPVVRGEWATESEVVTAVPGRRFGWSMRNRAGQRQESVWSYEIRPAGDGAVLVHSFWMGNPTEGIRGIIANMSEAEKKEFFADWAVKLKGDMEATVLRIKEVVEKN